MHIVTVLTRKAEGVTELPYKTKSIQKHQKYAAITAPAAAPVKRGNSYLADDTWPYSYSACPTALPTTQPHPSATCLDPHPPPAALLLLSATEHPHRCCHWSHHGRSPAQHATHSHAQRCPDLDRAHLPRPTTVPAQTRLRWQCAACSQGSAEGAPPAAPAAAEWRASHRWQGLGDRRHSTPGAPPQGPCGCP
jgi:hypothetical protein